MDFKHMIGIRRSHFSALRVLRKYAREAGRFTGAADHPLVEQVALSGFGGLTGGLRCAREELDVRRFDHDGWRAPEPDVRELADKVNLAIIG